MTDDLASSFREHLEVRLEGIAEDLQKTGYAALVLASGAQYFYFRDDQPAPYRANAHFLHFCPLEGPGHLLLIRPGKKPFLATLSPDDFWYEPQRIGDAFWTEGFKIAECRSRKRQISEITKRLPKGRSAGIAESGGISETLGLAHNPPGLLTRLDWRRAIKTGYEVACISEANRVGAEGHVAAEAAFRDGGSELDVHRAFLAAVGGSEADLPYPTIVGLNEKGAVLHYEGKRPDVRDGRSLLIDAGARVRGYASDITRTYAAAASDDRFRSLIAAMEGAQQALCEDVRAGRPWAELHHEAHLALSGVLKDEKVINLSPEEAVDTGLSRVFFPHGLGHFLGIQVHDVGGHLADPDGRRAPPPKGASDAPQHPDPRAGTRPDRRARGLLHRHAARQVAERKEPGRHQLGRRGRPHPLRRGPHRGQRPGHRNRPPQPHPRTPALRDRLGAPASGRHRPPTGGRNRPSAE